MTQFTRIVREVFLFLESEYGARVTTSKGVWVEAVTYVNATTAVRVTLEPHEVGIFVNLIRLRDGVIPEYPIFIKKETTLDWYSLRDIVSHRDQSLELAVSLSEGTFDPPESEIRGIVEPMARAMKKRCRDVLEGDFGVFDELEPIVKRRAAEVDALWKKGQLSRASVQAVNARMIEEAQQRAGIVGRAGQNGSGENHNVDRPNT